MIILLKNILALIFPYLRSRSAREFLLLAYRYGKKKRFQNQAVRFFKYKFLVPDCASFLKQFKEIYVEETYKFRATSPEPLILDCGANIGLSVLYFKEKLPRAKVKAFEADPEIAKILQFNIRNNGVQDVEVVRKALWIHNRGVDFGIQGADGGSVFFTSNRAKVPSVSLREELSAVQSIDLLKMDIEGAELQVLRDSKDCLHRVRNLFVEYHSIVGTRQRLDELLKILTEAGFRYYIQSVSNRKWPLFNKSTDQRLDLQLNIFAYRDK